MEIIDDQSAKSIMLDILCEVAQFCDKNNLRYYLAYGTLIGAIRHHGFIPWDDDIDIMMPRPDYDRFVDLYHSSGKYAIRTPKFGQCPYYYTKVYDDTTLKKEKGLDYTQFEPLGIDIDIFPIDGEPDDENKYIATTKRIKLISRALQYASLHYENRTFLGKIAEQFFHFIGVDRIVKQYVRAASSFPYENAHYVGVYAMYLIYNKGERFDSSIFKDRVVVSFEGKEFWAPVGYDSWLRYIYGDYMQLPPEEKRITHHTNNIYKK